MPKYLGGSKGNDGEEKRSYTPVWDDAPPPEVSLWLCVADAGLAYRRFFGVSLEPPRFY